MALNYNPFSLEGKKILVTGASSGIGRAIAVECSKMGASVVACGRNKARLEETLKVLVGDGHKMFVGDFSENEKILELVSSVDELDGAVLAASETLVLPVLFSTTDKFQKIYENNLFPNIEILRALTKKKKFKQNSSVVYIVAVGGTTHFGAGLSVYGSAKAALNSFLRFAAIELAPKKIRVNGISPGSVRTPMIHEGMVSDEQLESSIQETPLKRWGMPEDIAKGAVYLLSDAAEWVTGHTLVIDGGLSAK